MLLSAFLPCVRGGEEAVAVVAVVPGKVVVDVGDVFAVDIWLYNVTDMLGWQIELSWNTSMLYCVKARVNTPAEWGGITFDSVAFFNIPESELNRTLVFASWQLGPGINNTEGIYDKGELGMLLMGARLFSGSLAIVTLWFIPLQTGPTTLYFEPRPSPHASIKLLHPNIQAIPYIDYGSVIEVREPINIPTQHTAWLKK